MLCVNRSLILDACVLYTAATASCARMALDATPCIYPAAAARMQYSLSSNLQQYCSNLHPLYNCILFRCACYCTK